MLVQFMAHFLTVSVVGLFIFWIIGVLSGSGIVPGMAVLVTLGFLVYTMMLNSEN